MNKIRAFVSAKNLTPIDCVKLSTEFSYSDGIIKGFDYVDVSQTTVSIINICNKQFSVLGFELFDDNNGGGNFKASIKDFVIGPNQTINVPVYYNGIYLGDNLTPNYMITINGNSALYSLLISVPQVNHPPIANDIIIDLENRQNKVLSIDVFLNHFSDIDGDSLDSVIIEGNTNDFKLNGSDLVSGQQIPRAMIESGMLVFIAPDTNDYNESTTIWKAVDSAGQISI